MVAIEGLTPYMLKWSICGTVTGKSNVKFYKRGKYFFYDITDGSMEVRVHCKNDLCTKYFEFVQVGNNLKLKGGNVVATRYQSTVANVYEIETNEQTVMEEMNGEKFTFARNFVPLMEVSDMCANACIGRQLERLYFSYCFHCRA